MRVLLVENDETLGKEISARLRQENFVVDVSRNGEDGQHLGATERYDAAVLDLGLPKVDGISVLKNWRADGRTLPVLILTARDSWTDKVEGFRAGADDYLTKPFKIEELIVRLRALVRRANGHAASIVSCGPLSFDTQTGAFELESMPLRLTALEWRVLSCLIYRKGRTVERLDLMERVYDGEGNVDSNSVEVIIGRLRRKIGPGMIETERGLGYRLVEKPQ